MERTCPNGHRFFKTSDCPVCPICESEKTKSDPNFSSLGSPARRALANSGITRLSDFSPFTEAEIRSLHGMGPKALQKIKSKMEIENLSFKK